MKALIAALFMATPVMLATPAAAMEMADAPGGHLRLLDKLTGAVQDLKLANGQSETVGKVTVALDSCRYPAGNQTAEAEAHITVTDIAATAPVFNGWMIASSPALSALDHPRYDVWVLRCDVPDLALPEVAPEGEAPADQPEAAPATEDDNG